MINKYLPYSIQKILWGDRRRYGLDPDEADPEWQKWLNEIYFELYQYRLSSKSEYLVSQGYTIVKNVDCRNKRLLEIGPGIIRHLDFMNAAPEVYIIADINRKLLEITEAQLRRRRIPFQSIIMENKPHQVLPWPDESIDVVFSFYSLEHIHSLSEFIHGIKRILRKNGLLVGAAPCEGGLAWGAGRYFTTRRFMKNKFSLNYDKIICWEHPNFIDEIIKILDGALARQYLRLSPFACLPYDLNLIAEFIYKK